jgi:hypothetical protein
MGDYNQAQQSAQKQLVKPNAPLTAGISADVLVTQCEDSEKEEEKQGINWQDYKDKLDQVFEAEKVRARDFIAKQNKAVADNLKANLRNQITNYENNLARYNNYVSQVGSNPRYAGAVQQYTNQIQNQQNQVQNYQNQVNNQIAQLNAQQGSAYMILKIDRYPTTGGGSAYVVNPASYEYGAGNYGAAVGNAATRAVTSLQRSAPPFPAGTKLNTIYYRNDLSLTPPDKTPQQTQNDVVMTYENKK